MGWLSESLNSSIGKKFIMALTGISLILFLIVHLAGNLTLFIGEEAFNLYVESLDKIKPFIRVIEVVLAAIFIFHIVNGIKLYFENRGARPEKYAVNGSRKNSTLFSRTMAQTGSIIFIFLVIHLSTFWKAFNLDTHAADASYYNIVLEWFQIEWYAVLYVICMIILGFHLNHGFQSAFQTFGWNHNKYASLIKKIGTGYAVIMAVGFASIPIYFLLGGM
ncbi:MAG: succinate dehydrogenase cytochrome b subunit [Melioribacteraceae bacterium]|jgi:succinate dehydrogenase / fumarate reductase cytochrome b subunit|nr:succinate dehydrogenase [Ignavibacteriota bacterium]MBZ0182738.1 succinate dehydrogenase cytochrome b subunit [Melioribacteraceae bacterium]